MSKRNAIYRDYGLKNQLRKFQHAKDLLTGGHVRGPGGPTDDRIPAMLSNGEYVLPADTVKAVGKENLDRLRAHTHKFKDGGNVGIGHRRILEPTNPIPRRGSPPTPESPRPGIGDGTQSQVNSYPPPLVHGSQAMPMSDKHLRLYYADGGSTFDPASLSVEQLLNTPVHFASSMPATQAALRSPSGFNYSADDGGTRLRAARALTQRSMQNAAVPAPRFTPTKGQAYQPYGTQPNLPPTAIHSSVPYESSGVLDFTAPNNRPNISAANPLPAPQAASNPLASASHLAPGSLTVTGGRYGKGTTDLSGAYNTYFDVNRNDAAQKIRDESYAQTMKGYDNALSDPASASQPTTYEKGLWASNPGQGAAPRQVGFAKDGGQLRRYARGGVVHAADGWPDDFGFDPHESARSFAVDPEGVATEVPPTPPPSPPAAAAGAEFEGMPSALTNSGYAANAVKTAGRDVASWLPKGAGSALRSFGSRAGIVGAGLQALPDVQSAFGDEGDTEAAQRRLAGGAMGATLGAAFGPLDFLTIPAGYALGANLAGGGKKDAAATPVTAASKALPAADTEAAPATQRSSLRGYDLPDYSGYVNDVNRSYAQARQNLLNSFGGVNTPHHAMMLARLEAERLGTLGTVLGHQGSMAQTMLMRQMEMARMQHEFGQEALKDSDTQIHNAFPQIEGPKGKMIDDPRESEFRNRLAQSGFKPETFNTVAGRQQLQTMIQQYLHNIEPMEKATGRKGLGFGPLVPHSVSPSDIDWSTLFGRHTTTGLSPLQAARYALPWNYAAVDPSTGSIGPAPELSDPAAQQANALMLRGYDR